MKSRELTTRRSTWSFRRSSAVEQGEKDMANIRESDLLQSSML